MKTAALPMSFACLANRRFSSEMSSIVHSIAEFSSSAITIRKRDMIITAVDTAFTGRMIAKGVRTATKRRSSRNEGSWRTAAQKPSRAYFTDWMKFRKSRRFDSGGGMGSLTARVEWRAPKRTILKGPAVHQDYLDVRFPLRESSRVGATESIAGPCRASACGGLTRGMAIACAYSNALSK